MAKAASPVRLQDDLMQAATVAGERQHRSAAEQIEYWASIGRSVGKLVDSDSLLAVTTGLASLKIEPVISPAVDPEAVFESLELDRKAGNLAATVTSSEVRYQASVDHPGQLECLSMDGQVMVGQFSNGVFTPLAEQ